MDPTEVELNAINTIPDVGNWAGVAGDLLNGLTLALGNPTKLRDVAFISRPTWDRTVASLKMAEPPPAGSPAGTPATERDLTPVESSRIEVFRRVILLRLGIQPDLPGAASIPIALVGTPFPPAGSAGAPAPPTSPATTRKLKLSSVVDPTLDAEILQLDPAEVTKMYTDYKAKFGDRPSPDEPTADQLAGLSQLIKAKAVPYVEFSIWGAHGLRALRKSVFTSYMLNASSGEWSKKEAPGPPDLIAWERAFKTFRCAMLLLEAADPERLDAYMDFVKNLHGQFGAEAWGILYRAEVRMRSEFFERIRRSLTETPQYGFSEAAPWSAVFAAAIREGEFWAKEVTTPATLLLARNRTLPPDRDESSSPDRKRRRSSPRPPAKQQKGRKKYTGEDKSQWDSSQSIYALNRKGIQICQKFNKGTCGNGKAQSKCTNNRSHQCNLCLGPHAATACKKKKKEWPQEGSAPQERPKGPSVADESLGATPKSKPKAKPSPDRRREHERSRSPLRRRRPPADNPLGKLRPRTPSRSPPKRKPAKDVPPPKETTKKKTAEESSSSFPKPPMPKWYEHQYGATNIKTEEWGDQPRALLLFSGRPRDGDLASFLAADGWIVVVIDKVGPISTDLLDEKVRKAIRADVKNRVYDVVGAATPCETVSPLRENPPGPRPLRSLEHPDGLPQNKLTESEKKQLKEANILFRFSAEILSDQTDQELPWWMENPVHEGKLDIWKTSWMKYLTRPSRIFKVDFDQCRYGAETTKPTRLVSFKLNFLDMANLRCNHPMREWTKSDGSKYKAAHESLVQRWRTDDAGNKQRASKALAEYTPRLNARIAEAMLETENPRIDRLREVVNKQDKWPGGPRNVDFFGPTLDDRALRARDIQDKLAIGGMRKPFTSASMVPKSMVMGKCVYDLLANAASWKPVSELVDSLLKQQPAVQLETQLIEKVRQVVVNFLAPDGVELVPKTAIADTPLSATLLTAWGAAVMDPDAQTLAGWLQEGAPLGFSQAICASGVFPPVAGPEWEEESSRRLERAFEGWVNHPSAEEWHEDLTKLVEEAFSKGFCTIYDSVCRRSGETDRSQASAEQVGRHHQRETKLEKGSNHLGSQRKWSKPTLLPGGRESCCQNYQTWCMTSLKFTGKVEDHGSWQWTSEMHSTTSQQGQTEHSQPLPSPGKVAPKSLSMMCLCLDRFLHRHCGDDLRLC